jgi:hypothetical protein
MNTIGTAASSTSLATIGQGRAIWLRITLRRGRGEGRNQPSALAEPVFDRIAAQVAKLNPDNERDALLWIEDVSQFDTDEPR